jgi:small subunit ribosomal protein S16
MVVMDSRNRRDGAAIEELGWYNPIDADHSYDLKGDRVIHWLGEGAQPTEAAHKLLRRAGIAHQWHLMKQGLDEAQIEKEMKKWEMNREEVQQARAVRAEKKAEEKAAAVAEDAEEAVEETVEEAPAEEASDESTDEAETEEAPAEKTEESDESEESSDEVEEASTEEESKDAEEDSGDDEDAASDDESASEEE